MDEPNRNDSKIRFVDNYLPSLSAGLYELQVKQTLKVKDGVAAQQSIPENTTFMAAQEFAVSGPRFRLDPSDVHAMFPPQNSQGVFEDALPHIVFTKRALPWERSIFTDEKAPWLALLLFDPTEILPPIAGSSDSNGTNPPNGLTTISVEAFVDTEEIHIYKPVYTNPIDKNEGSLLIQVFDISPEIFKRVMPTIKDVKYLAHCREVIPTGGTETPGSAWYSVVAGGRFPAPPESGQPGRLNVVHLVSLEGFEKHLKDSGNSSDTDFGKDIDRIRIVSLANWTFTCLPDSGENFQNLMLNLVAESKNDALEFKLPIQQEKSTPSDEVKYVFDMIEAGFVPCSYQARQGQRAFAWYHGPFIPHQIDTLLRDRKAFVSSSQAILYDQKHGSWDMSYAVAWETGRLLALSDQRFNSSLLSWRRKAHRLIDRLSEQSSHPLHSVQESASETIKKDLVEKMMGITPQMMTYSSAEPAVPIPPLQDAYQTVAQLGSMYSGPMFQTQLQQAGEEELDLICEWLTHLYLLYSVPFNNLVPDERLLPPESIRFFYLDQKWLEVMLDGALSIGIQSSRDVKHRDAMLDFIREQVQIWLEVMLKGAITFGIHSSRDVQHRNAMLGDIRKQVKALTKDNAQPLTHSDNTSLVGLLLRSAIISGWPGLEVHAYAQSDEPVGILRMDQLAGNVLLCLFERVPQRIEFCEPKEGLHFGFDWGKIALRKDGKPTGDVVVLSRDPQTRKLDIDSMLKEIEEKLETKIGPAIFAMQMVKAPQKMVFNRN
jgi:hypothetical protein